MTRRARRSAIVRRKDESSSEEDSPNLPTKASTSLLPGWALWIPKRQHWNEIFNTLKYGKNLIELVSLLDSVWSMSIDWNSESSFLFESFFVTPYQSIPDPEGCSFSSKDANGELQNDLYKKYLITHQMLKKSVLIDCACCSQNHVEFLHLSVIISTKLCSFHSFTYFIHTDYRHLNRSNRNFFAIFVEWINDCDWKFIWSSDILLPVGTFAYHSWKILLSNNWNPMLNVHILSNEDSRKHID